GIALFARAGKRLTGLTAPGDHLLPIIERVLMESQNLRHAGKESDSLSASALAQLLIRAQASAGAPSAPH
ncbi:MAG: transcriptional regulator, LysR family, partial [Variovorax sp.]|nr:transcriptional regulator, LysR family [Variovorax sp.]